MFNQVGIDSDLYLYYKKERSVCLYVCLNACIEQASKLWNKIEKFFVIRKNCSAKQPSNAASFILDRIDESG